jgi:quercetin dioxygenase-like cupin family protein
MSTALPTIPPDNPKRNLTLAQPDNLPHIGLVGDTYTITVTGEQTDGRFCVIDMHIPPGGGPPPHRHDFEETFILLEGEMEATFRGKKSIVRAGDTLNIPANAPHQFHNASTGRYACSVSALLRDRRNSSWRLGCRSPRVRRPRRSWAKKSRPHSSRK